MKKRTKILFLILSLCIEVFATDFEVAGKLQVNGDTEVNGRVIIGQSGDISMGEYITGTPPQPISALVLPKNGLFARYDIAKSYKDIARTLPCIALGDVVQTLADLSGFNRHAYLDVGSTTQYVPNEINGNPVCRNASSDPFLFTINGINIPSTSVIYVLLKSTEATPFIEKLIGRPKAHYSSNPVNFPNYIYPSRNEDTSWVSVPDGLNPGTWQLLVFQFGSSGYVKINNAASKAITSSFTLTDLNFIIQGDLAEYIIYEGLHNPDMGDGLTIRKYFNRKYNLGLGL